MKRFSCGRSKSSSNRDFMESLEGRQLLSATTRVTGISADNRGEVVLTLSAGLKASTVTKSAVQAYTAGTDGVLGTTDDVHLPASIRYSASLNRITINATVAANTAYRVRLVSSRLQDLQGRQPDGEFNGAGKTSGNGHTGGIFEFKSSADTSGTPTARLYTSAGTITLTLYRSLKPISVANFLNYANSGAYDGIFVTRAFPNTGPFVEQMGGLKVDSTNHIVQTANNGAIASEFNTNGVISNTAYTVSWALSGTSNNTATNEFFVNQKDNSANLDNQNGGFTVFATANNASSIATIKAIANKQEIDFRSLNLPAETSQVPVNSSFTNGSLNPAADFVVIRRVSVINTISAA